MSSLPVLCAGFWPSQARREFHVKLKKVDILSVASQGPSRELYDSSVPKQALLCVHPALYASHKRSPMQGCNPSARLSEDMGNQSYTPETPDIPGPSALAPLLPLRALLTCLPYSPVTT